MNAPPLLAVEIGDLLQETPAFATLILLFIAYMKIQDQLRELTKKANDDAGVMWHRISQNEQRLVRLEAAAEAADKLQKKACSDRE